MGGAFPTDFWCWPMFAKGAIAQGREPAPGTQGPLANRNFLQALFAADSISKKQNTQTIEIGSNELVAGRLVEYHAAGQQALADIKPAVTQAYVQDRAAALRPRPTEIRGLPARSVRSGGRGEACLTAAGCDIRARMGG